MPPARRPARARRSALAPGAPLELSSEIDSPFASAPALEAAEQLGQVSHRRRASPRPINWRPRRHAGPGRGLGANVVGSTAASSASPGRGHRRLLASRSPPGPRPRDHRRRRRPARASQPPRFNLEEYADITGSPTCSPTTRSRSTSHRGAWDHPGPLLLRARSRAAATGFELFSGGYLIFDPDGSRSSGPSPHFRVRAEMGRPPEWTRERNLNGPNTPATAAGRHRVATADSTAIQLRRKALRCRSSLTTISSSPSSTAST